MKNLGNNLGKKLAAIVLIAGIVAVMVMLTLFIIHRMRYAVTDAMFVRTDTLVNLAFDGVSGRIIKLTKKAGDTVEEGEVLAVIDASSYRDALRGLEAQLEADKHRLKALRLKLERSRDELTQGTRIARESVNELVKKKAALESRAKAVLAMLDEVSRDHQRFGRLLEQGVISQKKFEVVDTRFKAKKGEYNAILREITAIQASIKRAKEAHRLAEIKEEKTRELAQSIKAPEFSIKALKAKIAIAKRNVSRCVLKSPMRGQVAKRFVAPGAMALPGKVIYSLVDPKDIYVLVLLEEGKLKGVKRGSPVNIRIDAYPKEEFKGVVEAVLPASAATFALIPRDVSAGEFTKVAQRIPIRVKITKGAIGLLKIGMGGEVEIKRQ